MSHRSSVMPALLATQQQAAAAWTLAGAEVEVHDAYPGWKPDPDTEIIARAVGERWASRIWASDTSLWTDDPGVADKIAHRLGWLFAPTYFQDEVAELTAFGEQIEREGYTDALVCGMGGSSLAPEVLAKVYPDSDKGLRIHVLDSTDPAAVAAYDAQLDPGKTIRVVVFNATTTTETPTPTPTHTPTSTPTATPTATASVSAGTMPSRPGAASSCA